MANGLPVVLVDPTTDAPGAPSVRLALTSYTGGDNVGNNLLGLPALVSNPNSGVLAVTAQYLFDPATGGWSRQRGNTDGGFFVSVPSATAPGLTQHSRMASADINATTVKAAAGKVYGFQIFNNTASAKYVRLYNKASAPNPAADTPIRRIMVPANGVASYHVGQGLDGFTTGIAYVATGGAADTDATALAANDLTINVDYR